MSTFALHLYSSEKRAFCLGDDIGFVKNGKFVVVEYDEERFSQLVSNVIASKRACKPEDVLRKSLLIYIEAATIEKCHKKYRIYESAFYIKWLKIIADSEEFKKAKFIAIIRRKQELDQIKHARLMQTILNAYPAHCKK